MQILTLGGGFVSQHLPYIRILDRLQINNQDIGKLLDKHKPDVLVNCIGKTGSPNVDWCNLNPEITSLTNSVLPILLADECKRRSIHLIHIGSGCIFYGDSPSPTGWKETDYANPAGFYSKTKYAADLNIQDLPNVTVLRIRMPISTQNHQRNLINKLKNYQKIINIPNSITFMDDFVRCVDWMAKNSETGIFHVTNPEPLTAVDIMQEYGKYIPHTFQIITEAELDLMTVAKRSNCILNTDKLQKTGFSMTSSKEALKSCMETYINNLEKNV